MKDILYQTNFSVRLMAFEIIKRNGGHASISDLVYLTNNGLPNTHFLPLEQHKKVLTMFRLRWKQISLLILMQCFITPKHMLNMPHIEIFRVISKQRRRCSCRTRHEGIWENEGILPLTNLGTIHRWGMRFTPRPIYPRGKSPRYPLNRRLVSDLFGKGITYQWIFNILCYPYNTSFWQIPYNIN
jgi:hypothetical protein